MTTASYYGDEQEIVCRNGSQRLASRTLAGTITLIPHGHDGRWDIAGPIEMSHVYLSDKRLQSCVDLLAGGKRLELLDRVGFEDPAAARILELLSHEAASSAPSSRRSSSRRSIFSAPNSSAAIPRSERSPNHSPGAGSPTGR